MSTKSWILVVSGFALGITAGVVGTYLFAQRPTNNPTPPTVDFPPAVQANRGLKLRNPHVNIAHFNAIQKGMTLDDLVGLLGEFSGSSVITEQTAKEGQWVLWEDELDQNRKMIRVRFVSGKVEQKVAEGFSGNTP